MNFRSILWGGRIGRVLFNWSEREAANGVGERTVNNTLSKIKAIDAGVAGGRCQTILKRVFDLRLT